MKPENLPEEVRAALPEMQAYYSRLEPDRVFFHPSGELPKGIPQVLRKAKVLRGYPDKDGNAWMLWYVFPPHKPFPYFGEEPPADAPPYEDDAPEAAIAPPPAPSPPPPAPETASPPPPPAETAVPSVPSNDVSPSTEIA